MNGARNDWKGNDLDAFAGAHAGMFEQSSLATSPTPVWFAPIVDRSCALGFTQVASLWHPSTHAIHSHRAVRIALHGITNNLQDVWG